MTTTDARKRHQENAAAEKLCRTLHPLEWRDDIHGRTKPCRGCCAAIANVIGKLEQYAASPISGCLDMEDVARIHNEGYTTAMRHARELILDLPTRLVAVEPTVPAGTTGQVLTEHVVRRGDLLAAFPAQPATDEEGEQ